MNLKRLAYCFHLALFIAPVGFIDTSSAAASIESKAQAAFERLEENTIIFRAPEGGPMPPPLKTGLFDLNYIGTLSSVETAKPYFLFSGKPCKDCPDDRLIYAVRQTGGKPTSFVYPGKIFKPSNRSLILESRGFWGKCLPRKSDVFVVFQREKIDRHSSMQSSVLVAEAEKDYLSETFYERNAPALKGVLAMVKKKTCHEIEGRNRIMLKMPIDLHPHSDGKLDDDDDDGPEAVKAK